MVEIEFSITNIAFGSTNYKVGSNKFYPCYLFLEGTKGRNPVQPLIFVVSHDGSVKKIIPPESSINKRVLDEYFDVVNSWYLNNIEVICSRFLSSFCPSAIIRGGIVVENRVEDEYTAVKLCNEFFDETFELYLEGYMEGFEGSVAFNDE